MLYTPLQAQCLLNLSGDAAVVKVGDFSSLVQTEEHSGDSQNPLTAMQLISLPESSSPSRHSVLARAVAATGARQTAHRVTEL